MVLQFIDKDEFIRILDKPTLTQQDIFKVNSYPFLSLAEKCGLDAAISHLFASVGYSFYYNNPSRYDISACLTENDAIAKVLDNALRGQNDNVRQNYNQKGELLFKDI